MTGAARVRHSAWRLGPIGQPIAGTIAGDPTLRQHLDASAGTAGVFHANDDLPPQTSRISLLKVSEMAASPPSGADRVTRGRGLGRQGTGFQPTVCSVLGPPIDVPLDEQLDLVRQILHMTFILQIGVPERRTSKLQASAIKHQLLR